VIATARFLHARYPIYISLFYPSIKQCQGPAGNHKVKYRTVPTNVLQNYPTFPLLFQPRRQSFPVSVTTNLTTFSSKELAQIMILQY